MKKPSPVEVSDKRTDELLGIALNGVPKERRPQVALDVEMAKLGFSMEDLQRMWPFKTGSHFWWPF